GGGSEVAGHEAGVADSVPRGRQVKPPNVGGAAVEPGAGGGGPEGGQAEGGEGADDARQDVARPGRGQPGTAGGVDRGPAGGVGHDRAAALQQHDRPGPFGQAAGGGDAVLPHLLAGQAGVLAGVGGDDGGGGPAGQEGEVAVAGVEAAGGEHGRA